MKIIEALKKIKHLDRKIEKAGERITIWSSYVETINEGDLVAEEPLYNAKDIMIMVQQTNDWQQEKARLRHLLHRTNILTSAKFDNKVYNIDELLLLQNIVLPEKLNTQKRLSRQRILNPAKQRVIMQYDPKEREKEIDSIEDTATRLNALLDQLSLSVEVLEG